MPDPLPRLLLTAPASGGGKTTLTLALLRSFQDRGLRPASFKCGPDYIDPLFHREVLGVDGYNLDGYFAPPAVLRGLVARGMAGADVGLIEGAMGYYDGVAASPLASAWETAAATATPAVLVLHPRGAMLSLAALVNGFRDFRAGSNLRGLVLNRCPERLHRRVAPLLERETGLRVYGFLPEVEDAVLPSRHLGLTTPDGVAALQDKLALLGRKAAETVDVDGLLDLAASAPPLCIAAPPLPEPVARPPVRLAVARDEAFCFHYRENLELLQSLGADIAYFSPLRDAALPEGAAALYLCGGYPELHAAALAANAPLRAAVAHAVRSGMPTLAECGGFLYLHERLRDRDGFAHPMAGVLPGESAPAAGPRRFGYVELTSDRDTLLGPAGTTLRAHEFHYWDSDDPGDACTAVKPGSGESWPCVQAGPALFAGFPHLALWSNPACAAAFVRAAGEWRP